MSANEEAIDAKEQFLDTFSFVIAFLRSSGLHNAEQVLLQELSTKYPLLHQYSSGFAVDESSASDGAGTSSQELPSIPQLKPSSSSDRDKQSTDATQHAHSKVEPSGDAVHNPSSSSEAAQDHAAAHSRPPNQTALATFQSSSRHNSKHGSARYHYKPAWGTDVDEYEDMDDVGYFRRDVVGQQHFAETELDLTSEEGSEHHFVTNKAGAAHDGHGEDEDEEDNGTSDSSSSTSKHQQTPSSAEKSSSSPRAAPVPTHLPAQLAQQLMKQQDNSTPSSPTAHVQDEAWDLGPTDIKFAEPVTTPSKNSTDRQGDETRPVLSRVESLSSSFKDFDIERIEDDQYLSRLTHPSEGDMLSDTDVIDFAPPSTECAVVDPEDLEKFTRGASGRIHSGTISVEASTALVAESSVTDALPNPEQIKSDDKPTEAKPEEAKENGGGFSFQLPVTSPPEEPEARLFKSWPSVRSSCASEVPVDDENATPGEYADDDYRSKLSSRSPSQTLSEPRDTDVQPPSATLDSLSEHSKRSPPAREPSLDMAAKVLAGRGAKEAEQSSSNSSSDGTAKASGKESKPAAPTSAAGAQGEPQAEQARETVGPTEDKKDTVTAHQIRISKDEDFTEPERRSTQTESGISASESDPVHDDEVASASLGGEPVVPPVTWEEVVVDEDEADEPTSSSLAPTSPSAALVDSEHIIPRYTVDENGVLLYEYDAEYIEKKYEVFSLKVIHRRHRTGFEETKDFPIRMNDLIAGRYQVMDFLGSAAFSRAVQALDVKTGTLVCLKIIKNNKDYFDQSLDEIKLLKYVNTLDPNDEHGLVRLYDYFYYKEHLFLVCELLRANLYEFQKYNKESGDELYFTNARIQKIAVSVLKSLAFLHSLGLIHSDLKPENILIKSYSRCEVKVIDLGSSCFITDQLSSYVQSRSYRAPEVILGLPYDHKVDIWSLGCILAELSSGYVLFQNDSLSTLLARLEGILGPIPDWMVQQGRYSNRFFTRSGHIYERSTSTERYELLVPKRTCMRHRVPEADEGLLDFIGYLLSIDPHKRPTAAEALSHPWLQNQYASLDSMS
eukprot:CAMPEP_0202902904 /NCGR_PEP_ID=MMETSP1392-20130828/18762_1 /ASSEMBLY_ACC=CAM_ASM_000868 /TAXON_ID=225041 /ORGANISM="Chlamydomonas chlamydogama, Strain SAG 11-48b" /LENGTH=1064 /DNA_ID=CAMNT_0049589765 /DNA_START=132 /DNA_END=3326 /DNA_ORIENTATION=-